MARWKRNTEHNPFNLRYKQSAVPVNNVVGKILIQTFFISGAVTNEANEPIIGGLLCFLFETKPFIRWNYVPPDKQRVCFRNQHSATWLGESGWLASTLKVSLPAVLNVNNHDVIKLVQPNILQKCRSPMRPDPFVPAILDDKSLFFCFCLPKMKTS